MSFLASQALIGNERLRTRVAGAVRKVAAERVQWAPPAGVLARAGYRAPETVVDGFMLRLATNGDAIASACEACGHADNVTDTTIEWIVGDAWDAVAVDVFGEPDAEPVEPPAA